MPGELDPLYVAARSVLLDALEGLGPQRDAVILVGAQAIYLYTGAIELPIAEHTTDADVTIDPNLLKEVPEIASALSKAGFSRLLRVGAWVTTKEVDGVWVNIELDLMCQKRSVARAREPPDSLAMRKRSLERCGALRLRSSTSTS